MRGPLTVKSAIRGTALFGGPQSLKPFLYDCRVFSVIVCVHLHIRRANVHLITRALYAMVVGLLAIVTASLITVGAVVARRVPHETVLQALVPLLVPLEVSDHLLFLHKHSRVTIKTMEVLSAWTSTKQTKLLLLVRSLLWSDFDKSLPVVWAYRFTCSSNPGNEQTRIPDNC